MAVNQTSAERKFIYETKTVLESGKTDSVLAKLRELKSTGNVTILPFILNLLTNEREDIVVVSEVLHIISDLKEQDCAPVVAGYIEQNKFGIYLAGILAACWQSRLDFSPYLPTFIHCFAAGDYQEALESFTVIEEMLWKTPKEDIESCKSLLLGKKSEISAEKESLYAELLKVLNEGESGNREDYPDIYDR